MSVWGVAFNDEIFFCNQALKLYKNLDLDLSANKSVIGFQI